MAGKLPPKRNVVVPRSKRSIRGISALPTHHDYVEPVQQMPERAPFEDKTRGSFGILEDAMRAMAENAGGFASLLTASGFSLGGVVTGRTASYTPDAIRQSPRRAGRSDLSDALAYAARANSGEAVLLANRVRSTDAPGVTPYEQVLRLARQAVLQSGSAEIRVNAETAAYIMSRIDAGNPIAHDGGIDRSVSLYGIPVIISDIVPENEIHMVHPPQQLIPAYGDYLDLETRLLSADDFSFFPRPAELYDRGEWTDENWRRYEEDRDHPTIKNDGRQMEAPHRRFLEENARYSMRRRR